MTKVLVSDPIDQAGIEILGQVAQVDQRTGLSKDELIAIIGEYDGLMIRSGTQVSAAVIAAMASGIFAMTRRAMSDPLDAMPLTAVDMPLNSDLGAFL